MELCTGGDCEHTLLTLSNGIAQILFFSMLLSEDDLWEQNLLAAMGMQRLWSIVLELSESSWLMAHRKKEDIDLFPQWLLLSVSCCTIISRYYRLCICGVRSQTPLSVCTF